MKGVKVESRIIPAMQCPQKCARCSITRIHGEYIYTLRPLNKLESQMTKFSQYTSTVGGFIGKPWVGQAVVGPYLAQAGG